MPKDAPPKGGALPDSELVGPASAGIGDADQTSPLGGGPIPAAGSTTCPTSCVIRRRCSWRLTGSRATPGPGLRAWTASRSPTSRIGMPGFLDDLRAQLKQGTFRPLPVRERKIPKPGGSPSTMKFLLTTIPR